MEDREKIPEATDRKEYVKVKNFEELTFHFYQRRAQSCPVCFTAQQGFGLDWHLSFKNENNTPNRYDLVIKCNENSLSNVWEMSCSLELDVFGSVNRKVVKDEKTFNSTNNSITIPDFLEFDQSDLPILNLVVDLRITMKELVGLPKNTEFDFENEYEVTSDATLVAFDEEEMKDRKLYVSKSYLSLYSPVFREMFLKLEREKKTAEIEIEESYKSAIIFLNLIYPSHCLPAEWYTSDDLEAEDVGTILHMAETYEIDLVFRKLEEFLVDDTSISLFCKIHFAEVYDLDMLMNHCLLQIESVDDARIAVSDVDYSDLELSNKTKAAIFGRLMSLPPTMRAESNTSDSSYQ